MLKKAFILVFTSLDVFEEKVIADFPRLMHWPDAPSYTVKMRFNASQLDTFVLVKNIVSSAKSKWLIGGQPHATLIPAILPSCRDLSQSFERTSVQRMKR